MAISLFSEPNDNISLSELKAINLKKRLIITLTFEGEYTIPNLSKETGYSVPTVTKLIGELIEEDIIYDFGKIGTSGGRRPNVYGINPKAFYVLGVEVKRESVNIGLQSADTTMTDIATDIDFLLENNRRSLERLCDIINDFISQSGIERKKIVSACVNLSGRINAREGFSYSYFYFEEKPLSSIIEANIQIRTYLENDSRAMAFGEFNKGIVKNEQEVLFINISWGLGMGIVCNGHLYYGKSGYSGEFGHAPVFDNEILCQCGKKGCLETEVSGMALDRKIKNRLRSGATSILTKNKEIDAVTISDVIDAVIKHEDVLAIEVIEEMGEILGRYLAMLVNIFNPEMVIIGGTLAAVSEYMQLPIQTAIKRHSLNLVNQDVQFKTSQLRTKAGVVGACFIARGRFFDLL